MSLYVEFGSVVVVVRTVTNEWVSGVYLVYLSAKYCNLKMEEISLMDIIIVWVFPNWMSVTSKLYLTLLLVFVFARQTSH